MKLYYYRSPDRSLNFGDDLNPWLWEKLLPGVLDQDESIAFVGIGTLLNDELPMRAYNAPRRIIFGTGVGYGGGLPQMDESYKIYCLRGTFSAKALGVSEKLAIADAGILVRTVYQSQAPKTYKFSYMPHHILAGRGWERVCQQLGFQYIDPRQSVDAVLEKLSKTELLLTEAMHGAIIADALRIPWVPIVTNSSILAFKWQDWCNSIEVAYEPMVIDRLYHPRTQKDLLTPVRMVRDWTRQQASAKALREVAQTARPVLSRDARMEQLTVQLQEKLEQFKRDVAAGQFTNAVLANQVRAGMNSAEINATDEKIFQAG